MNRILKKPLHRIGYDFIFPPYLPEGKDEYYLRNQFHKATSEFRSLSAHEIEVLVKNENKADDWSDIYVSEKFDPKLVKNCHFHGMVRIGSLENYFLEYHELQLPVGLYNSTIVACDIGNNVVIKNVDYLGHYQIGNEVILFNINEMHTTNHAKFGNGIIKDGEDEEVRVWIEICNENGGRKILPFDGILPADAFLWSKYRDDKVLMERFVEMTENTFDSKRGYYGKVGDRTVIKNTRILRDVKIGSDAYIKGGNKLKNLTINSSPESPSQIGEGVELVNGIIGYGSRAFYGVKAVRFVMGENTCLKYGARLINSMLGDNSTISCCEVLNSLILPAHEQHHNNSFLCAATVLGQSNIAAGATIGSNHNSRGADGELFAGRGFWPALCVNLKHNSRFASFNLVAKGAYPYELNVPFPFALISQNESEDCIQIMPAYWFMYNMYALARNSWKYGARDKRERKEQILVFDYLAPDTVNEVFDAIYLLESLIAKAYLSQQKKKTEGDEKLNALGRTLLLDGTEALEKLKIIVPGVESSRREVRLLKSVKAYHSYRKMIHYYGIKGLLAYAQLRKFHTFGDLRNEFEGFSRTKWVNVGGQLLSTKQLDELKKRIRDCEFNNWHELHEAYTEIHKDYLFQNAGFAFASLLELYDIKSKDVTEDLWYQWLELAVHIQYEIADQTFKTREKDYTNPFRKSTYDTQEEMTAVLGKIDDNGFIKQIREESKNFELLVRQFMQNYQPSKEFLHASYVDK